MRLFYRTIYIIFVTKEWRDEVLKRIKYELNKYEKDYKEFHSSNNKTIIIKSMFGEIYLTHYTSFEDWLGQRIDECYLQPCIFRKSYRFKARDLIERILPCVVNNDFFFVISDIDKSKECAGVRSLTISLEKYIRSCAEEEPHLKEDYPYLFL